MSEGDSAGQITLHFCALCNESVPQADLDAGRAVVRKERVICATCERLMSGRTDELAAALPNAAPAGANDRTVRPTRPTRSGAAVGWFAFLVAAGGIAYFATVRDRDRRELDATLARDRSAADERAKQTARELELASQRAAGFDQSLETLRGESRALSLEAQKVAQEEVRGVGDKMAQLEGDLNSVREQLALAGRRAEVDTLRDDLKQRDLKIAALEQRLAEVEKRPIAPVVVKTDEGPAQRAQPIWFGIVAKLKSTNFSDRWSAVQELGETHDPAVAEYLIPMLEDADVFVRMVTAQVLGDLASTKCVDALIAALNDAEIPVRVNAYAALRKLTKKDLPFDPEQTDANERQKRIKAWQEWWKKARENGAGS